MTSRKAEWDTDYFNAEKRRDSVTKEVEESLESRSEKRSAFRRSPFIVGSCCDFPTYILLRNKKGPSHLEPFFYLNFKTKLPDRDALLRCQVHLVTLFHIEGFVEISLIGNRAIAAEFSR